MATRCSHTEGKEEDEADIVSQIFDQVKVTFKADEVGPLPLNESRFVEDLQSKCGVRLKCKLKFIHGEQTPDQYVLEGKWREVKHAKNYLERWVKNGRELQERVENLNEPEGMQQDSPDAYNSPQYTNTHKEADRLQENESTQNSDHQGTDRPDVNSAKRQLQGRVRELKHESTDESDNKHIYQTRSENSEPTAMKISDHTLGIGDKKSGKEKVYEKEINESSSSRCGRNSDVSTLSHDLKQQPSRKPLHEHEEGETVVTDFGGERRSSHSPSLKIERNIAVGNEEGRNNPSILSAQYPSPSSDDPGTSGNLRNTSNSERAVNIRDNHLRSRERYPEEKITPAIDRRERSLHLVGAPASPLVSCNDANSKQSSAESDNFQCTRGAENINYVPVDAGVFAYMEKMFGRNIQTIERKYKVKISTEDIDVNESAMVKITSVGETTEENIRLANEAVVDLYANIFRSLSHRVVQLEESSITQESLAQVVENIKKLYKEVLVKVSGSKLMIYGEKELDVKVAKAMVTNRLYNLQRSTSPGADKYEDKPPDDLERSPLLEHVDVDQQYSHENLLHLEEGKRKHKEGTNEEHQDLSPAQADKENAWQCQRSQSNHVSVSLKYRYQHDRLSYKTAEGLKVRVYLGDITKEKVGAIVNAANEFLKHVGGVAEAIATVAGSSMSKECDHYIAKHVMLYPGKVMWTHPGNLPCQYVIHAVGPRWKEYKIKMECYQTLKTTFFKCLELADKKLQVAAVAMPLISSGIFGMPMTQCVDALYEAIVQFSQSWNTATNILKEINVVEIQDVAVKAIQHHLIGKLTGGDGEEAVVRHLDIDDKETVGASTSDRYGHAYTGGSFEGDKDDILADVSGQAASQNYNRDYLESKSTGLHNRQNQREVDDIFQANRTRLTHEGTQTSLLYDPNAFDTGGRLADYRRNATGSTRFSSLPNLSKNYIVDGDNSDLAVNYRNLSGASELLRESPKLSQSTERLENYIGMQDIQDHGRLSDRKQDISNLSSGATGGTTKEADNESLIQSILNKHEIGKQTPEQIAKTQKLIDRLLSEDVTSSGRSREKGSRSRRAHSLDRATRKSKEKDQNMDRYDLNSDLRIKGNTLNSFNFEKCAACTSNRDLTQRKDCEHMLCRSCYRIGLYKGQCSLCKIKSRGSSASSPSSDEHRSRPKTRKSITDTKIISLSGNTGHAKKDYRIKSAGSSVTGYRKGPMTAMSASPSPTSPELDEADAATHHTATNSRLDPVGQALNGGVISRDKYHTGHHTPPLSRKSNARVEAWMSDSELLGRAGSKMYNHTTYSDKPGVVLGSSRAAERQRKNELSPRFSIEGQKQDMLSSDKSKGGEEDVGASTTSMCPICLDILRNPKTLSECKHSFCASCIDKAMKVKALCPVCGVVYGPLYGNQPAGSMTDYVEPSALPGYDDYSTIVISYRFPDGVQSEGHPNPGHPFRGTARMAYLPNNVEGQEVFRLLEKAFKARLLFTIGQSATTGELNTVIWNDVHHKTRRSGGPEFHGYPDPDYLRRVKDELSVKGIK